MPATTTARVGDESVPVRLAESIWQQARGFRGRLSPPNYALAYTFDETAPTIDMLGVGFPLDVAFIVNGTVQEVVTLAAWTGLAPGRRADTVLEVPLGHCDIHAGMAVVVDE